MHDRTGKTNGPLTPNDGLTPNSRSGKGGKMNGPLTPNPDGKGGKKMTPQQNGPLTPSPDR